MSDKSDSPYKDPLLSHEYDGIREFDNPMPGWWKAIFWASFYFALGYFFHYHISENGDSVAEAYEVDIAAAREREAKALMGEKITEEALAGLMANEALMADAKTLFATRCGVTCHGNQGEGKIGPNLTDAYWLHGDATLMSIMGIIQEGVPAKGMPAWGRQLRPVEVSKLAAYIGTLRNTNVKGPKGPEGKEIATPGATTGAASGKEDAPAPAGPAPATASAPEASGAPTTVPSAAPSAEPTAAASAESTAAPSAKPTAPAMSGSPNPAPGPTSEKAQ